jgi:thiamine pyrophosphate-dependent acetolactate synthase large subunit-like protein
MTIRQFSANPSQVIVEQLVASGVKYVFNNPGSREALFFDALASHNDIHGIMALHEGSVAAMAGGYTQGELEPAVMSVHLGAGLAQSLGQLINIGAGGLPVVVITFAGDTGSFGDKVGLDLDHNFGPTSISAPFTKATWAVMEPEGLPQAIDRAIRVAKAPPMGPVHLAVYDRVLGDHQITTGIIENSSIADRAGYPSESDADLLVRALAQADRPLLYIGDGVWKSGAGAATMSLAERLGTPIAGDTRAVPIRHSLHCGPVEDAVAAFEPDTIVCIGVRQNARGNPLDFAPFTGAKQVFAVGPDIANLKNIPGVEMTVLADEARAVERMLDAAAERSAEGEFDERRSWAMEQAAAIRIKRREVVERTGPQQGLIRPWILADALDDVLEDVGGGMVMIEQFTVSTDAVRGNREAARNVYMRVGGPSEGYGVGGAIGLKLAVGDTPVVGLVGDGSLYYADSALWSAAHHRVPLLYVVPNNRAYGIVAGAFERADGTMKETGGYAGVALENINPVKISEGFGVEARDVDDEAAVATAISEGLDLVERERRPMLLNVHVPQGLPQGGHATQPYRHGDTKP